LIALGVRYRTQSGGSTVTAVLPDRWLNELSRTSRDLRLVRGDGAYVWDDEERRYLDMTSSGGTTLLGHNHPRVTEAMSGQLTAFSGVPPGFDYDLREELLEALSFIIPVPLTHVSFTTSGSSAADLALTWVASASHRPRLIAMQRSDHGSGIGGRGASSGRGLGEIAGRSLDVVRVPFDDLDALRAELDNSVAAVLVEPVQVEAGIRVPADGYLAAVADLCRGVGALLVVDEVRTALRMGPTLASAAQGVGPDIVCLGSSLANGLPFGVTAVGPSIARRARVARRDHDEACPPLVCAAANATIRTALSPTLRALAELTAERLQSRLRALRLGEIRDVRGCGAMVAVETSLNAPMLLRRLEQRGILALPGGTGSVRLLAPLILERREADGVVESLAAIILGSRPPRRRSVSAQAANEVEVVLPGRPLRRQSRLAL
jgi:acetylornithine/succinyldiaminopimelate/putrescine aminotransferase